MTATAHPLTEPGGRGTHNRRSTVQDERPVQATGAPRHAGAEARTRNGPGGRRERTALSGWP